MPNSPVADRFTFNAYDLFSNFLPGAILLLGIAVPFLLPGGGLPSLNLIEAISVTVLAFAIGIGTQSVGSMVSKYKVFNLPPWKERVRPFNKAMEEMLDENADSSNFNTIHWAAHKACVKTFNINSDDDDEIELLFKSLLAYLESSKWSRGLRIQSLHLASRGLYIVSLVLGIYFLLFAIGLSFSSDSIPYSHPGQLSPLFMLTLGFCMIPVSWIFFTRARHFEDDVSSYILAEFLMSQSKWEQKGDISDIANLSAESD